MDVLNSNLTPCCHIFLPHITCFDIKEIHQRFQSTHFMLSSLLLFQNVTHYTNSLLSCIHVNTTNLLDIMCTTVAMGMHDIREVIVVPPCT